MINIYQVDDAYWYAAKSPESALQKYLTDAEERGISDEIDLEELGTPTLISEPEIDKLQYRSDDDYSLISFREQMKRLLANNATFPAMFATTEY